MLIDTALATVQIEVLCKPFQLMGTVQQSLCKVDDGS